METQANCPCVLTGCAWHTLAISSHDAPYSMANTASLINSPATYNRIFTD